MIKIIHISDLHISRNNFDKVFKMLSDLKEYQDLSKFFIVITGDFTDNNNKKDINLVKRILSLFVDCKGLFLAPGNHDYFSYNGNGFFKCDECIETFNKEILIDSDFPITKIVYENFAFIGLDSAHPDFFASGKIGKKQLIRLNNILQEESIQKARLRIVYLHHHSFDSSLKWWNFWSRFMKKAMELKDSKAFLKTIKAGGVNIVLNGHKHSKLGKLEKYGISFFNGGSSSGIESRKGVSLIEIDRNNEINYQERWNFYEGL